MVHLSWLFIILGTFLEGMIDGGNTLLVYADIVEAVTAANVVH